MRTRNKPERITKEEKIQGRIDHRNREVEHKEMKEKNISIKLLKMVKVEPKVRVGITRKNKSKSKTTMRIEKNSRRINAKIAKKVFRPTGSKKRK